MAGRWDSQSVHITLYNKDGGVIYDEPNAAGQREAYLIFREDKSYDSITDDILSWSGTYSWHDSSLTLVNPIQGTMTFIIEILSPTELIILSDRRVGKEGGITRSKFIRH
ncbi:hypothetical protein GCM10011378_16740 [Hymenobacter glacieicola]|uniref:Lipocalin-like domain-containing protein n=1 Tax=Hymenobacter glacieicola TaxID=1562124 RepID=A0ABQ1WPK0_9BACT|nr:hypothetical protein GCM10011378_16740 [Hymenobacter glacieicola]